MVVSLIHSEIPIQKQIKSNFSTIWQEVKIISYNERDVSPKNFPLFFCFLTRNYVEQPFII